MVKILIEYSEDGQILQKFQGSEECFVKLSEQGRVLDVSDNAPPEVPGYILEGQFMEIPQAPSPHHEWDWSTKSWLPNLDAAKAARKSEIEAERNRRINEPLTYDGKVLDADQAARDNLKAKLEEVRERIRLNTPMAPELLVWRDNANQTHSWPTIEAYHDWLAGYAVAMSERGTQCYACAWYHKDAIGRLSTVEAVMDYNITQGWPA